MFTPPPCKTRQPSKTSSPPQPRVARHLVDRIFDYLLAEFPQIAGQQPSGKIAMTIEAAVQKQNSGARGMLHRRTPTHCAPAARH